MNEIKIKIKLSDLYGIKEELVNLKKHKGVELAIASNRNIKLVNDILKPLEDGLKESNSKVARYKEYNEAISKLQEKHAEKNESGEINLKTNVETGTQSYSVLVSTPEYKADAKAISEEFSDALTELRQNKKDYEEALEKEEEIMFYEIPASSLNDEITGEEIENLVSFGIIS